MPELKNYILFNEDGSLRFLKIKGSIQQGNNNVNEFFVAIDGLDNEDYTCVIEFERPDGDVVEGTAEIDSDVINEESYNGYYFTIPVSATLYAGIVKMNLKLLDLNDKVLCTYQVSLRINPTGYQPDATTITEAQYNLLLQSLNGYQGKYAKGNVRSYDTLAAANEDLENLGAGQMVIVKNNNEVRLMVKESASSTYLVPILTFNDWVEYIGFIVTLGNIQGITLTEEQLNEASKPSCVFVDGYENKVYTKKGVVTVLGDDYYEFTCNIDMVSSSNNVTFTDKKILVNIETGYCTYATSEKTISTPEVVSINVDVTELPGNLSPANIQKLARDDTILKITLKRGIETLGILLLQHSAPNYYNGVAIGEGNNTVTEYEFVFDSTGESREYTLNINYAGGTRLYKHTLDDVNHRRIVIVTNYSTPISQSGSSFVTKIYDSIDMRYAGATTFGVGYLGSTSVPVYYLDVRTGATSQTTFDTTNYTDTVTEL